MAASDMGRRRKKAELLEAEVFLAGGSGVETPEGLLLLLH